MYNRRIRVEIVSPVHNRKPITLQCLRSLSSINRTGLEVHAHWGKMTLVDPNIVVNGGRRAKT